MVAGAFILITSVPSVSWLIGAPDKKDFASISSKALNTAIFTDEDEVMPPLPDAITVTLYELIPVLVNL